MLEFLVLLRQQIEEGGPRVAHLGGWPDHIDPTCLRGRIPGPGDTNAPGFDAGIACALGLIPLERQLLSARLHANYTKAAMEQVRRELERPEADSETVWWLAACSVCQEGGIDEGGFLLQLAHFVELAVAPERRLAAVRTYTDHLKRSYSLRDGVPYGEHDSAVIAAYLDGHAFGTMYNSLQQCYYIGTYEASLGLEDFPWSQVTERLGETRSGPVFGSRQFVRCNTSEEYARAARFVATRFAPPPRQSSTPRESATASASSVPPAEHM